MSTWNVNIVSYDTGEIIKTIECESEAKAHKVSDGVDINLNTDKYYTQVKEAGHLSVPSKQATAQLSINTERLI